MWETRGRLEVKMADAAQTWWINRRMSGARRMPRRKSIWVSGSDSNLCAFGVFQVGETRKAGI